jgi:hypothetical protein
VLDTTPWVKGVIPEVPKTYSVDELREKIEKTHGDVLIRDPIALVPLGKIATEGDSQPEKLTLSLVIVFKNSDDHQFLKKNGGIAIDGLFHPIRMCKPTTKESTPLSVALNER